MNVDACTQCPVSYKHCTSRDARAWSSHLQNEDESSTAAPLCLSLSPPPLALLLSCSCRDVSHGPMAAAPSHSVAPKHLVMPSSQHRAVGLTDTPSTVPLPHPCPSSPGHEPPARSTYRISRHSPSASACPYSCSWTPTCLPLGIFPSVLGGKSLPGCAAELRRRKASLARPPILLQEKKVTR